LDGIDGALTEYKAPTAEEFWEILCPQHYLFAPHNKPIFRGQADEKWHLEPRILREMEHPVHAFLPFRSNPDQSEHRIFEEINTLRTFAEYCDSAGLRIPGDSEEFRRKFLDPTSKLDSFIFHRPTW
jgi:hypothetical protein